MKIRVEGTKNEIKFIVDYLKQRYPKLTESRLYQNRNNTNYRCYLELSPYFSSDSTAQTSSLEKEALEAQPDPWDAVLGGEGAETSTDGSGSQPEA